MQRNVTDILREWFYRLPHGYAIQPYNNIELQVLSRILTENNIDPKPIIESLRGDIIEAEFVDIDGNPIVKDLPRDDKDKPPGKQALTENLHEILFSIVVAYIIGGKTINMPKSPKELETTLLGAGARLKGKALTLKIALSTIKTGGDRYLDDQGKFNSEFKKYWDDAAAAASNTLNKLKSFYKGAKLVGAERVNVRGKGASEVADDVIYIKEEGMKNLTPVSISLKYGEGQFGSLSVAKIFEYMFGFDIAAGLSGAKSLLAYMYKNGYAADIDEALQLYVRKINEFAAEANGQTFSDDDRRMKSQNTAWHAWNAAGLNETPVDPSGLTWLEWKGGKGGQASPRNKAYRYVYTDVMVAGSPGYEAKKEIRKIRNTNIHDNITDLIESIQPDQQQGLTKMMNYILRTAVDLEKSSGDLVDLVGDPTMSYFYVADSGDKIISLPSFNQIDAKAFATNIILSDRVPQSEDAEGDYERDLLIYGGPDLLATIKIKLRFSNGQWTSDYAQKGPAPKFEEGFEEYFRATGFNSSADSIVKD